MSLPSISGVINFLTEAGFQARRAYPGAAAPELTDVAVTVSTELYDTASSLLTARVEVRCPAAMGAGVCEETAVAVAHTLLLNDARCRQGPCGFDGRTGQFYVPVEATWASIADGDSIAQALPYYVQRGGVKLSYAIGFTAKRVVDTETVGAIGEAAPKAVLCRDGGWELTLEELFPRGALGEEPNSDVISLDVVRNDGVEFYRNCRVLSLQRKDTMDGIKQTTVCHCRDREVMDLG